MCQIPFSVLEGISACALALLAGYLGQPNMIAVLEWMGHTVNSPEDLHSQDVMQGVGMLICGVLGFLAFFLYRSRVYDTAYYRGLNNRDVRTYRRREDEADSDSDVSEE